MKMQRLALALTTANLVVLGLILGTVLPSTARAVGVTHAQPSAPDGTVVPVLRGRALELLDDRGRVRSRINVEQDGAVVFRLLDQHGTIRVKLGADENGSGLLLLDESASPGVHIIARRTARPEKPNTTSVTLHGANGQQRVITP